MHLETLLYLRVGLESLDLLLGLLGQLAPELTECLHVDEVKIGFIQGESSFLQPLKS